MSDGFQIRVQWPIPFSDEKQFEEFIEDYFNALEETKSYQLFGRKGQSQHGLDVISQEKNTVIQCKLKDVVNRKDTELVKELIEELNKDFSSFEEYNRTVGSMFRKFILASTFKDDTHIQTAIIQLNSAINIEYWSWGRLTRQMPEKIRLKYYSEFDKKISEYYNGNQRLTNEEADLDFQNEERDNHGEFSINSDNQLENQKWSDLTNIEQIEELFSQLYDQIEFVPIQILIRKFPLQDKPFSRYSHFVLNTTNKDLDKFFNAFEVLNQSSISILDDVYFTGCTNIEQRIQVITQKLTNNLIYYIRTQINSEWKDVRFFNQEKCSCARCQIEKFSFKTIDFKIEVKESRIENLLNQAYAHYKMGQFKNAFRIYKQAEDDALKGKKELSLFVIRYNLIHLASFLEHNYYEDEESKKIAKELRLINLSNSICEAKNGFHAEFQKWMLNDHYMLHFHTKISEIKQQLIDHYQNTLQGGSGSNNYVNDLINQYAQLHQFLQQNTIINDCYKPFLDIVEMVIEGLFASFAVQGERSSKIDSFNDWTLTQIIKYGRTPSIRRLANRYNIRELHYEGYNDDNENTKELIIRLFDQFDIASQKLRLYEEPNYDHFSNDYNRWLNNALYIVSHTDFDKAFIRKFTDTFISYYKSNTHRLSAAEIGAFLVCKFHLFTQTQRKKLLLLGLKEEQLMRSYYLQNFAQLSVEYNFSFKLDEKDIHLITQRRFNQLSNIISLVHVYRCLSEDQKKLISQKITDELSDSFKLDIWSSAVLYDVIPFKNEDLIKAIDILTPKENIPGKPGNPFGGSRYNGGLDQFINVCYYKDIDLSDCKFDGLRENSNYYKWLLNVDGFDYTLFDSSWLMEFGTKPYLKRFSKSDILKKHVETLLSDPKEKNKKALKEAFMDVYILK